MNASWSDLLLGKWRWVRTFLRLAENGAPIAWIAFFLLVVFVVSCLFVVGLWFYRYRNGTSTAKATLTNVVEMVLVASLPVYILIEISLRLFSGVEQLP